MMPTQDQSSPAVLRRTQAIVVGGGPAGLMAAQQLAQAGLTVSVYDRMPTLGRKFLLAGRGGLNLTHGEALPQFLRRYDAPAWMEPILASFPPQALRDWAAGLGEPTFVGSSGRVFPKSFKASPLLRAWLRQLDKLGVSFHPRHRLVGIETGKAHFFNADGHAVEVAADVVVLALGGASWSKLGSDGSWVALLKPLGVESTPLFPANCGFNIAWSDKFRCEFAGTTLKTVRLRHGRTTARGAVTLTQNGMEGGIVYAISAVLRAGILAVGKTQVEIDLRPDVSQTDLAQRLARPRGKQSLATFLRKTGGLDTASMALMREALRQLDTPLPVDSEALSQLIKAVPLDLTGLSPIERAISTAGGVARHECNRELMLKRLPGVFVAGEMLDWDAPTGGYLLQACFATGFVAGNSASNWAQKYGAPAV